MAERSAPRLRNACDGRPGQVVDRRQVPAGQQHCSDVRTLCTAKHPHQLAMSAEFHRLGPPSHDISRQLCSCRGRTAAQAVHSISSALPTGWQL